MADENDPLATPELSDDAERLENVVDAALESFWARVASEYPEVTSGDTDPGAEIAFKESALKMVRDWLYWNQPSSEPSAKDDATPSP